MIYDANIFLTSYTTLFCFKAFGVLCDYLRLMHSAYVMNLGFVNYNDIPYVYEVNRSSTHT